MKHVYTRVLCTFLVFAGSVPAAICQTAGNKWSTNNSWYQFVDKESSGQFKTQSIKPLVPKPLPAATAPAATPPGTGNQYLVAPGAASSVPSVLPTTIIQTTTPGYSSWATTGSPWDRRYQGDSSWWGYPRYGHNSYYPWVGSHVPRLLPVASPPFGICPVPFTSGLLRHALPTWTSRTTVLQSGPSRSSGNYYQSPALDPTASGNYYGSSSPVLQICPGQ